MRVQKRETTSSTTKFSTTAKTSSQASVTATFSVAVGTSKPSSSSTSTTVAASPLPSPLDSLASTNFDPGPNDGPSPCLTFINSFLVDPTFKSCYPLSLLYDVGVALR